MSLKFICVVLLFTCLYYVCDARTTVSGELLDQPITGMRRFGLKNSQSLSNSQQLRRYDDEQVYEWSEDRLQPLSYLNNDRNLKRTPAEYDDNQQTHLIDEIWSNEKHEDVNRILKDVQ